MSKRLIGWLVFVTLVCVGLYYLSFLRQSRRPVSLALEAAGKSTAVVSSLGSTNLRKTFVTGRIIAGTDYGNADITIHVASPNGHGVLLESAQNGFQGWHICSLVFRTDQSKQDVTLVDDTLTNCERE
jgi:hypothetical protein